MPVDIPLARTDVASAPSEEEDFQRIHKDLKAAMEDSVDAFPFILNEEIDPERRIGSIKTFVETLQLDILINGLFPAMMVRANDKLARLVRGEKIESPERDAWDRKNLPHIKEVFPELLAKTKDLKHEVDNTMKRLERNVSSTDTVRSPKPAIWMTSHISGRE